MKLNLLDQPKLWAVSSKLILVMKLTCFLLFVILQVSAKSFSQKITINKKNATFEQVFKEISNQSGYHFLYDKDEILKAGKLTINVTGLSLVEILNKCLQGKPLAYKLFDNMVVIKAIPKQTPIIIQASGPVSGVVRDELGNPLPGASVKSKSSGISTSTNTRGEFKIQISGESDVLTVSFVSYETKDLEVRSNSFVELILKPATKQLGEVIVSSFGIKKSKQSTTFAAQSINSESIAEAKQYNIGDALQGKISGVQITSSSGVPGASADILIRGGTSLDGNNQPLFVIDGIPIDNSTIAQPIGASGQLARSVSNSNRAVDINPEDIESISVLKGPSAAALYGLRAAAGAIIITTKKGVAGEGKISFSSSAEIQTENKLPEFQDTYKMGTNGQSVASRLSWGPVFGTGDTKYNNAKDFFKTGTVFNNNLSFSGGTDKAIFYASGNNTDQKGIVPNTDFKKTSIRVNSDLNVLKNVKVSFTSNYINTNSTQALQGPGINNGSGGVFGSIVYWPISDDMKNYLNTDGTRRQIVPNINEDIDNPYWSVLNNPVTSKVDRFIGTGQISYDPLNWLNVTYRIGTDLYKESYQSLRSPGTSLIQNTQGGLLQTESFNKITTSTFLINAKGNLTKDIGASLLLGQNLELDDNTNNTIFGTNFINPGFVSINNTSSQFYTQYLSQRKLVGVFGDLQLNYKRILYVDATGRNDWSSTLPASNRSFFYPSVGTSFIFSNLLNLTNSFFTYGKLRATYAKVGKDAQPNKLQTELTTDPNIVLGGAFGYGYYANNASLKPEFTNSIEFGTELGFFKNRLGLDLTYYHIQSQDQITQPRVSQGTGFIFKLVNGGTIDNKGVEATITGNPVKTTNFRWDVILNWSTNKAKVTALPVGTSVFRNSDAIAVFDVAEGSSFLNGNFYAIRGTTYVKNNNGQVVIGANGYPSVNSSNQVDLGVSRQPDWISGITNSFTYKNYNFSFLIDIRKGGKIFNGTDYEMVKSGLSTKTLNRGTTTVLPGVIQNADGSYSPNTKSVVLDQNFYQTIYAANAQNFIEDGSWYRLRYVTFTYTLPAKLIGNTPIKKLSVNVTGKNLILISKYSGFDPELSSGGAGVTGTGSVGIDYLGFPSTKGISFGINATF